MDGYIQVFLTPPPGKSIQVMDLDLRPPLATADVPEAKWSVETPDGRTVRMTGQQLLNMASAGSDSGIPTFATRTAYRQYAAFVSEGELYRVLTGIPSTNTETVAELLASGTIEQLTQEQIERIESGATHFYRVRPFHRGVHGRFYRGVRAFPEARVKPFYRGIHGKFHRGVRGKQDEKRQQDAKDVLRLFDGVPELVADYMWDLIMDRIPAPTALRDAGDTYNLIRARIEGYVTGYTEAFTSSLKTKLDSIESNATRDQSGTEIVSAVDTALGTTRWKTERVTANTVLSALQALSGTQEGEARTAIQALGRDITLSGDSELDATSETADIIIEVSADGDISIATGTKTIAAGSTWVGIDFAGGVI